MIDELKMISKYAGMREDLVQAGGGNTSIKVTNERMYIKASGYQLADVNMEFGCALVNAQKIIRFFEDTPLERIGREQELGVLDTAIIEGERPSIETVLHAITDRVTLHTHPVLVNILVSRDNGMEELEKLFPDAMFVPYATPGISLAKEYFKTWKENGKKPCKIVFLKNHGLIVSGTTAEVVIITNEKVMEILAEYLGVDYSGCKTVTQIYNVLSQTCGGDIVYLSQNRYVYEALHVMKGIWRHDICPDCIVYCGKKVLRLGDDFGQKDIEEFCVKYGKPVIIKCKDYFYIVASNMKKAKEIESLLGFSAQVAIRNIGRDIDFLSDKEQDFLLHWDAEKYRKNLK